jgi:predicted permease
MPGLRQDLRQALRALRARPGASAIAILMLAAGLSVNTVLFSVVNGLVLRPQVSGGADIDRLVRVMSGTRSNPYGDTSFEDFRDLRNTSRTLTIAAEGFVPVSTRQSGRAAQVWALFVSSNYFDVLGAPAALGRTIRASDDTHEELVAAVSRRFWEQRLGGADLAGLTMVLNGRTVSVVGVLPERFRGPGGLYVPDVWLPLERAAAFGLPGGHLGREMRWLRVVGRLRPGTTVAQADAEVRAMAQQLAAAYPATNRDRVASARPLRDGYPGERDAIVTMSVFAMAATGIVLLIACFNVAGLLLARSVDRQREMGIRASLGASRARIVQQLLVESVLLAALAGVAAIVLSIWSRDLLASFRLPAPIPQEIDLNLDVRALWFSVALVVVAGLLPGLVPAWHVCRPDLVGALKGDAAPFGGRARPARLRSAFVVLQLAGSTAFLALAALFAQSFASAALADPGFNTSSTLLVSLEPQLHGYDSARARSLLETLTDRLRDRRDVQSAALTDFPPFGVGFPRSSRVSATSADCERSECPAATEYRVTPGYLDTLGIRLTLGRDLAASDDQSVAVVTQTMAERLWPGRSPLGESFFVVSERRAVQVVGVARTVKLRSLGETAWPHFYRRLGDGDFGGTLWVAVDARETPSALFEPIRDLVAALDPNLPLQGLKTMREQMELPLWAPRTAAAFFGLCALVSVLLAAVGLFGVTFYSVGQRTREFGVRLALGATRRQVLSLVLGEGLRLALIGMGLGVAGALALARVASFALYGVTPGAPGTYVAIALLQAIIALAASLVPAYRATQVDPLAALRAE